MKPFQLLLCLALWTSTGCRRDTADRSADDPSSRSLPEVRLRQEWFPNSNYAGAVFAAKSFARQYGIRLNIVPGADNIDPIKLLLSGEDMVADVGADKVLLANSKGADLVVIGVLNRNSPTCFLAKMDRHIRTPKDFEGKRIGILTGTATEFVYRTLVAKQKLDKSKLQELEAPFDLGTFISDAYDVRPAFIYDEPVSLDLKNIQYTVVEPRSYGVDFLGTVYVTTRQSIRTHHDDIQAFVSAVADGWKAALKYPDQAINLLVEYDKTINKDRELLSLRKAESYFRGRDGRVLHADFADWEGTLRSLKDLGAVGDVDLHSMIDESFLLHYESALKR